MTKINIVGLSGHAGSGKDYIAQHYILPLGYVQWSFAWHFKVWLIGKGEATYEEVFHTKPPHIRKLLQEEGTERGRMVYGENVWCNTAKVWMETLSDNCGISNFCIADIRFPNEVEFIQSLGGKVLRIVAPERSKNSSLTPEARMHISETALNDYERFDGYIFNDPQQADTVPTQIQDVLR